MSLKRKPPGSPESRAVKRTRNKSPEKSPLPAPSLPICENLPPSPKNQGKNLEDFYVGQLVYAMWNTNSKHGTTRMRYYGKVVGLAKTRVQVSWNDGTTTHGYP